MTTLLIAFNGTRENGNFCGDQLCAMKAAQMFANEPGVDRAIMSVSPGNEMSFLWDRFVSDHNIELVYDDWNPGDWSSRWQAWDKWRTERQVTGNVSGVHHHIKFDHYRELYLRIHGAQRQTLLCSSERGLGRRNIYEYWVAGQENAPEVFLGSDVYDVEIDHPSLTHDRDVYISPHAKTQGNITFTFDFWSQVVHKLLDAGVSVTVGYDGHFCDDLLYHPLYKKHWGSHKEWMQQVCSHKLVACGNTGTGWLAAACGVPMITMEPPNSQMPDHRYRECGLRNIVEMVSEPDPDYVARRIVEEVRKCIVMTTGCYDVLHAGHVRHLERARAMGTKLIVAMNSDQSVRSLKGTTRPINPQSQRKAVLEALRSVDEVRITDDPLAILHELRPDVLAVGYGYSVESIVGREFVESYGGRAVVTSHGDASDEPSTTKVVKKIRAADVSEVCRLATAYSVNPFDKLKCLAEQLLSVVHLSGTIADLGTCRGGTALVMRLLAPNHHLNCFDTWEGTPYDDPLCHHKQGEWKASLDDCSGLVGTGPLTWYHQGVFPQGDYPFGDNSFCFVYVDMDTYQATKDAIEFFWPRMVPGGKIVLDDYGWEPCAGVKKAVDESFYDNIVVGYQEALMYNKKVVKPLYTCILERR